MKRLKLRKKETQLEMSDYSVGEEKFKYFIKMNHFVIDKMSENEKEHFIFMAGFYAACQYRKEEN